MEEVLVGRGDETGGCGIVGIGWELDRWLSESVADGNALKVDVRALVVLVCQPDAVGDCRDIVPCIRLPLAREGSRVRGKGWE